MANEPRKLTDTEVAKLDKEYKELIPLLLKQIREQVETMRAEIPKDKHLTDEKRQHLMQLLYMDPETGVCNAFKLALFRVTDANALQKSQIQVTYDIHDDVYDYLRGPISTLPKKLRGFLDGGSVIDPKTNKALMEDLGPQTGKTKTGVPKYDEILRQQGKLK